ncbi:MAG: hypothetical protein M1828_004283 [Chrysothrix sp. TS-e1954]|nr:MAG: hypothetical protein M1828_004283 [Chrysothrix sp. TS-e1954]
MYSATLRSSPIWAPLIPSLASPPPSGFNLRESQLSPHDLAIPFPEPCPRSTTNAANKANNRASRTLPTTTTPATAAATGTATAQTLKILLLSPSSLPSDPAPTSPASAPLLERLTHFSALTGGRDVLIVFLLHEACSISPSTSTSTSSNRATSTSIPGPSTGLSAHAQLTTLLFHHALPIPLIPLTSPPALLPTLKTYLTTLTRPLPTPPEPAHAHAKANKAITLLLPLATATPPPHHRLTEHQVLRLTDLVGSVRELARVCAGEEGRVWVIGEMDEGGEGGCGRGVVEFWGEEFVREV